MTNYVRLDALESRQQKAPKVSDNPSKLRIDNHSRLKER